MTGLIEFIRDATGVPVPEISGTVLTRVDLLALLVVMNALDRRATETPYAEETERRAVRIRGRYQSRFDTIEGEAKLIAIAQIMVERLGRAGPLRERIPPGAFAELEAEIAHEGFAVADIIQGEAAERVVSHGIPVEPGFNVVTALAIIYKWLIIEAGVHNAVHSIRQIHFITARGSSVGESVDGTRALLLSNIDEASDKVWIVYEGEYPRHFVVAASTRGALTVYDPVVVPTAYTTALVSGLREAKVRTALVAGTQGVSPPRKPLYTTGHPTTTVNVCGYHAAYMAAWLATGHLPASTRYKHINVAASSPGLARDRQRAEERLLAKTDNWIEPIQEMFDAVGGLAK
ncbi:MAG: hypothetical protein WC732_09835 [Candidatus Omnitrophota bacterium]